MGDLSRFRTVAEAVAWARREGFLVVRVRCRVCGDAWVALLEPGANPATLECAVCGAADTEPAGPVDPAQP